jgi:hypothetical protein
MVGKLGVGNKEQMSGNYSFVNRTIKDWNRLPAGVLASVPSFPGQGSSYKQGGFRSGLNGNK